MKNGIEFRDVTFSYPGKSAAISNINIGIECGSFVGITGTNGSGKSTLSLLMNGLIPHTISGRLTGDVCVDGINTRRKSVAYFSRKVGMVFQNPDFSLFNLTVADEIGFGLKNFYGCIDNERIRRALDIVGLKGFDSRDPQSLSFGEKQKICLACVLALDVSYIVLDEPTAMLDYKSSVELYIVLSSLNRQGKTIIVIEHDTDFLLSYARKILILDKGAMIRFGSSKEVFSDKALLTKLGIKIPHQKNV